MGARVRAVRDARARDALNEARAAHAAPPPPARGAPPVQIFETMHGESPPSRASATASPSRSSARRCTASSPRSTRRSVVIAAPDRRQPGGGARPARSSGQIVRRAQAQAQALARPAGARAAPQADARGSRCRRRGRSARSPLRRRAMSLAERDAGRAAAAHHAGARARGRRPKPPRKRRSIPSPRPDEDPRRAIARCARREAAVGRGQRRMASHHSGDPPIVRSFACATVRSIRFEPLRMCTAVALSAHGSYFSAPPGALLGGCSLTRGPRRWHCPSSR